MKKIIFLSFISLLCGFLSCSNKGNEPFDLGNSGGRIFFIDSQAGSDLNSGTSESSPWKTLSKVKKLLAGDKLYLKRGSVFLETWTFQAEGTKENRILVDAYGAGNKPHIKCDGKGIDAVKIYNSSYLTFQNIEISNKGQSPLAYRKGLFIECKSYGVCKDIVINSIVVHDVNGDIQKGKGEGSGIYFSNSGVDVISTFDGLVIENCHIYNCERNGITSWGYTKRDNWHPNKNVVIRYNLLEGIPGDGIVPIGCDGAIVEYNLMRDCSDEILNSPVDEAAVGIWPWSSDNTVIQFNEVSDHKAYKVDGQGYDADFNCKNTIIQYNYSHNNSGGFVLVCNKGESTGTNDNIGNEGSVVRYNISLDDGRYPDSDITRGTISLNGPITNTTIEKNVIYSPKVLQNSNRKFISTWNWGGYGDLLKLKNNICIVEEPFTFQMGGMTNYSVTGNYFLGNFSNIPSMNDNFISSNQLESMVDPDDEFYGFGSLFTTKTTDLMTIKVVNKEAIEAFFNNLQK